MAASRTGHVDAVQAAARGGRQRRTPPTRISRRRALMWAAAEGHADVVKALLAAGADPNRKAHVTGIDERKHGDHPTGGFTALMFAARNGHEDAVDGAHQGRRRSEADQRRRPHRDDGRHRQRPVRSRGEDCSTSAPTPNDGSLYFAVDMHDATTDMRAHDGSRLRADHPNKLTSLDLVKLLLDKGADPNKPFVGPVALDDAVLRPRGQQLAVLSRGDRVRRRRAEADARARREGRVEPDRGQEGRRQRPRAAARTPTSARRRSWWR